MKRKINIGDMVICTESGVIGKVLRFYVPTSCAEQTMVLTNDGRKYHAPTSTWTNFDEHLMKYPSTPVMHINNSNNINSKGIINENTIVLKIGANSELIDILKKNFKMMNVCK